MTKKERLEDLGRLAIMLSNILDDEIFENTESKHAEEEWTRVNHDKIEYGSPRGLNHIFMTIRGLRWKIEECHHIAEGIDGPD